MAGAYSEMSNFFEEQGRTRVYDEAYWRYVEEVNPRRTPLTGKRAIAEKAPLGAPDAVFCLPHNPPDVLPGVLDF